MNIHNISCFMNVNSFTKSYCLDFHEFHIIDLMGMTIINMRDNRWPLLIKYLSQELRAHVPVDSFEGVYNSDYYVL